MKERLYCSCGVPVFRLGEGCRVCWLVGMTSFDVRAHDEEERGYDAEGEALSTVDRRCLRDAMVEDPTLLERCNSTDGTTASASWLPGHAAPLAPSLNWSEWSQSNFVATLTETK